LYKSATGENRLGSQRRGKERRRESSRLAEREIQSIRHKWKRHGLKMAVGGKGQLSIIINVMS
jgi:hypothetical protein